MSLVWDSRDNADLNDARVESRVEKAGNVPDIGHKDRAFKEEIVIVSTVLGRRMRDIF